MTRSTPRNQPNVKNNKRKLNNNSTNTNNVNRRGTNPKRGGPGILITCETGRDNRAKREGLLILEYYWHLNHGSGGDEEKDKKLSLEDEIASLKKAKKKDSVLVEYDTGCRGTVSLMCVLHACALVAPMERDNTREDDKETSNKKPKVETESKEEDNVTVPDTSTRKWIQPRLYDASVPPPWDPLEVVHKIITDIQANNTDAPSSRFISRMIPIQATCYATLEEITHTANALLDKYLSTSNDPRTFAVMIKRRNCSLVTKDQVIECIYNLVVAKKTNYTVKLKNADITIVVEICKTLCGISVIEDCTARFQNFNLQEFREKAGGGEAVDAPEKEKEGDEAADKE